jgi:hypothetical protein
VRPDSVVERTRLARFGSVTAAVEGDALQFQMTIDPEAFDEEGTDGAAVRHGRISVTILAGIGGFAETSADVHLRRLDV